MSNMETLLKVVIIFVLDFFLFLVKFLIFFLMFRFIQLDQLIFVNALRSGICV